MSRQWRIKLPSGDKILDQSEDLFIAAEITFADIRPILIQTRLKGRNNVLPGTESHKAPPVAQLFQIVGIKELLEDIADGK